MAQFASTLYPQTNPSNPVLLRFREHAANRDTARVASNFLSLGSILLAFQFSSPAQDDHARRVLTRLAAFSG